MNEKIELIKFYENKLGEKLSKKLGLNVVNRLLQKVKVFDDYDLFNKIDQLINELRHFIDNPKNKKKTYYSTLNELKKLVKDKYGFVAKGTVQGQYTAIGIALGSGIGAAFIGINPAFMSIGLPIGIAIGAGIGATKEKELEEQGKLY